MRPLPEWLRIGGSTIFFLVMLDDTLAYLSIIAIAFWSNKELKKREKKCNTIQCLERRRGAYILSFSKISSSFLKSSL